MRFITDILSIKVTRNYKNERSVYDQYQLIAFILDEIYLLYIYC